MIQLIYKYLIIHQHVPLAGVGVFYLTRQPAKHDVANKVFSPPVLSIDFKPRTTTDNKDFFTFLSKEKDLDKASAIKYFGDLTQRIKYDINAHKPVELPGLGILRKNANGDINFEPANVIATYFPPAVAEPVLREKASYEIRVGETQRTSAQMREALHDEPETVPVRKDYWWIYAIILAVIGIAAILYYYQHNGSLR